MFYSHDILTSREHGVATIWLVATLGAKSVTRKLNRKAILDVDVPKACNVIVNPEAPMALRLQGSLLYGVSRVYNQQCGYTLTDVQAMHARLKMLLRTLPDAGLDAASGKARPEQLVLPYDPTFLPEVNLPGLNIDITVLGRPWERNLTQQSSLLLSTPTDLSQSSAPPDDRLQLHFSSDDLLGYGAASLSTSATLTKDHLFRKSLALPSGDEEGVLLQPDFEFDEDGNIVELGTHDSFHLKGHDRLGDIASEALVIGEVRDSGRHLSEWEPEPVQVDDEVRLPVEVAHSGPAALGQPQSPLPAFEPGPMEGVERTLDGRAATQRRSRNVNRVIEIDRSVALRNTDLARWNNEYANNMAVAARQKQQNKLPAQARRNAAFWVYGQGIGGVGVGLGLDQTSHPLSALSGDALLVALQFQINATTGKKRSRPSDEDSDSDSSIRRVRAREESEKQVGRGQEEGMELFDDNQDVEFGRHAPPSIHDEHSSQMPWNITASIQTSRHGSSALAFRGYGSASDFSSRAGGRDALGRLWNRLTSASPLAARSRALGMPEYGRLSSLDLPGDDDIDVLGGGDFDISDNLRAGFDGEYAGVAGVGDKLDDVHARGAQSGRHWLIPASSLDTESIKFLNFIAAQVESAPNDDTDDDENDEDDEDTRGRDKGKQAVRDINASLEPKTSKKKKGEEVIFSALFPPSATTRVVATKALMHVLTLATKGFLSVMQEDAIEEKSHVDYSRRYTYGEILLRLS